jgi:beta-1,2-mannosidase
MVATAVTAHDILCAMVRLLPVLLLAVGVQAQAPDWALGPFRKPSGVNPVLTPDSQPRFVSPMSGRSVRWQQRATFNPAAVVRNDTLYVLFRAEDESGVDSIGHHTSRIGLAFSTDGLRYARRPTPVLYPDNDAQRGNEWPGGVEDPRIVERDDGTYVLTYTQWNREVPRLAVATSRDLVTWTKHGPAFARAAGGKYLRTESKSGAIVSRLVGERLVATRVNGKYWMYFGVPEIRVATSDDLIEWTPLEDSNGRPLAVLTARPGYFDSWLVEPGPPALLTQQGIVLLYNAGNNDVHNDPTLPVRVYTAGQALFDSRNPIRLLDRTRTPFLKPTEEFERTGQYREGTTFVEGLVRFKGRWHLFYGSADSRVGLALADAVRVP